jgi:hypothetical protein
VDLYIKRSMTQTTGKRSVHVVGFCSIRAWAADVRVARMRRPSEKVMQALRLLSEDPKNEVYVISGLQLLPLEVPLPIPNDSWNARLTKTGLTLGYAGGVREPGPCGLGRCQWPLPEHAPDHSHKRGAGDRRVRGDRLELYECVSDGVARSSGQRGGPTAREEAHLEPAQLRSDVARGQGGRCWRQCCRYGSVY